MDETYNGGPCLSCGIAGSIQWLDDPERWLGRCRNAKARGLPCEPHRAKAFAALLDRGVAHDGWPPGRRTQS
jgi:hypothetical protein